MTEDNGHGTDADRRPFVSRGGLKLEHALVTFGLDVAGLTCADLGCSTGGFTDVLIRRGARRVYAVDTGYGVIDWTLRNDKRVVAMERTNAMHVMLPEPVDLVVIDAGWTRQEKILPHARTLLSPGGRIVTLLKPHYEVEPARLSRTRGVLPDDEVEAVVNRVVERIEGQAFAIHGRTASPIRGSAGRSRRGNQEFLLWLEPLRAGR